MADEKPRRFIWMTGNDWSKITITALVSVLATITVFWFNSKSPDLIYSLTEPSTFNGQQNKFSFMTLTLKNEGNKDAEVVEFHCDIFHDIKEIAVTPEYVNRQLRTDHGKFDCTVDRLGVGQSIQFAIMTNTPDIAKRPDIDIFAHEVRARNQDELFRNSWYRNPGYRMLVALPIGLTLGFILLYFLHRSAVKQRASDQAKEEKAKLGQSPD